MYLAEGGECGRCGTPLEPGWHGDHDLAASAGGETDVVNGVATCPTCNLTRGATDLEGRRTESLRAWQQEALDAYDANNPDDFLVVATPGAGKTRFAGVAAGRLLRSGEVSLVVVVVPTERLKGQWADAVASAGVNLDPRWSNADGALPAGFDGVCVTYAQVAAQPELMRHHVSRRRTLVVLDEVHHCGDSRSWGDAIRHAFAPARRRISLSGTPFRSDNCEIPFVRYVGGHGTPDYIYEYGSAIRDGVCRPVFFPTTGGRMEWAAPDGTVVTATFDEELDGRQTSQRLRTALSLDGGWLTSVVADAHSELTELRRTHPDAGGLMLAADQEHARGVADLLRSRHGVEAAVVTSDDPAAGDVIEAFSAGDAPWLVSVRMVSEGIDIPRLRVAVFAAATITELFFRQAVGRIVRSTGTDDEVGLFFIPDDPRLRQFAATIRDLRDHAIDSDVEELLDPHPDGERSSARATRFHPISSEAIGAGVIYDGGQLTPADLAEAERIKSGHQETAGLPTFAVALLIRQLRGPGPSEPATPSDTRPTHRIRDDLRAANDKVAKRVAHHHGLEYAEVHRSLNAHVGVGRVRDADIEQLRKRLAAAQSWLTGGPTPSPLG